MFDLDDALTIESYRIPWLFWIQILIFFLLIFLLCCFSLFTSDLPPSSSLDPLSISHSNRLFKHNTTTTSILSNAALHRRNQATESEGIKAEIGTGTSTSGRMIIREEETENEGFSSNGLNDIHPCNYFRLAKLAFLKCFGLDPTSSDNSSSSESRKER